MEVYVSTTTKFTPGPWSAGKTTVFGPDDQDGHVTHIASVAGHNDHAPANAALIAAAPELYATLEYLLPHLAELDRAERHRNRNNPTAVLHAQVCINNVQNALGKARGEVVS